MANSMTEYQKEKGAIENEYNKKWVSRNCLYYWGGFINQKLKLHSFLFLQEIKPTYNYKNGNKHTHTGTLKRT